MSWWRRCVTGLHVHLWMPPRPPPRRIFFCQDRENREVNFKKVSRLNFIFWKWGIRKATNFNFSPVAPTKKLWERSWKWQESDTERSIKKPLHLLTLCRCLHVECLDGMRTDKLVRLLTTKLSHYKKNARRNETTVELSWNKKDRPTIDFPNNINRN